jgi:hypothetical protein
VARVCGPRAAWALLLDTLGERAHLEDILTAHVPMRFRLTVPTSVFFDDPAFETLKDLLGWAAPCSTTRRGSTPRGRH